MNELVGAAGTMFGIIKKEMPDAQVRPLPSLELIYPEVNLLPERDRLRASNMNSREFGVALDVLMDGRKIGDFKEEGKKKIDLVLSDVIMPGMNGRQLAEAMHDQCPHVKAVLMSGYTDSAMAHKGFQEPGVAFLEKPFSPEALTRKVREVLDESSNNLPPSSEES